MTLVMTTSRQEADQTEGKSPAGVLNRRVIVLIDQIPALLLTYSHLDLQLFSLTHFRCRKCILINPFSAHVYLTLKLFCIVNLHMFYLFDNVHKTKLRL